MSKVELLSFITLDETFLSNSLDQPCGLLALDEDS